MASYGYPIEVLRPGSSYQRGEVRYEGREAKREAAITAAREELLATTPLEEVADAIDLLPPRRPARRRVTAAKPARSRGRRSPTTR